MAAKEAELRKAIEDQSGEIADLRKSNNRMKAEIFARVSCISLEKGDRLTSRDHRPRIDQRTLLLLPLSNKTIPSQIKFDSSTIKRWSNWSTPTRRSYPDFRPITRLLFPPCG